MNNTENLKVAAYFNKTNKCWVARHKKIRHMPLSDRRYEENIYGYGSELVDAVSEILAQVSNVHTLICKVILPSKHMTNIQINLH